MPSKEAFQQAEIEIAAAEKELEQATQALNATLAAILQISLHGSLKNLVLPTEPVNQPYITKSTTQTFTMRAWVAALTGHNALDRTPLYTDFE